MEEASDLSERENHSLVRVVEMKRCYFRMVVGILHRGRRERGKDFLQAG